MSIDEKTAIVLEEWKCAMENARHFNDLLMRLRMLGLPMVITLAIAGIASNAFTSNIMVLVWPISAITLSLALLGIVAVTIHTIQKLRAKSKTVNRAEFSWWELLIWIVFLGLLASPAIYRIINLLNNPAGFFHVKAESQITPFALVAAIVLLTALYFMDRFYYYKLLIGAVTRSVNLEKTLEFEITQTTCNFIPIKNSQNLVTLFYCLPGIILLGMTLIWFR